MIRLIKGDTLTQLKKLPSESVQTCICSPPYWCLRDYGVAGQLGLEPTPEAYVARMVEVFREVKRVLRDDGVMFLNIGDSYAGGGKGNYGTGISTHNGTVAKHCNGSDFAVPMGLKPKDLVGIPWRLAFALQANGWYLRSDIIWHKPNPMPESVRDRPTKAHEYVFLLSKSARYFFDADAVREPQSTAPHAAGYASGKDYAVGPMSRNGHSQREGNQSRIWGSTAGRNIRSVWTITPKPFRGAHFATFPPALVERCVKAGTSERGACPHCGKAWERVTQREQDTLRPRSRPVGNSRRISASDFRAIGGPQQASQIVRVGTLGFRQSCTCPAAAPVPCVVLDPFIGSGTVATVAKSLGRDCIGIDLNPKYLAMARARVKSADASAKSTATRKVAV
jgi:DNA modification methylase